MESAISYFEKALKNSTKKEIEFTLIGSVYYLEDSFDTFFRVPAWAGNQGQVEYMIGNFRTEDGDLFKSLEIDKTMIQTEKPCMDWKTSYKLAKSKKQNFPNPMEFYFGYL